MFYGLIGKWGKWFNSIQKIASLVLLYVPIYRFQQASSHQFCQHHSIQHFHTSQLSRVCILYLR